MMIFKKVLQTSSKFSNCSKWKFDVSGLFLSHKNIQRSIVVRRYPKWMVKDCETSLRLIPKVLLMAACSKQSDMGSCEIEFYL